MEGLALTLWPPTAWHWLALGLVLLSIEMMTGMTRACTLNRTEKYEAV